MKSDKNNSGTLHEDQYTFCLSYLVQLFLEWEMFQTKVIEIIKTHILSSINFFENRVVYEIMWRNTVDPYRPQMTAWRMRIPCWITAATNTHSEYVILLAFSLQQWLQERFPMLRYTHSTLPACLLIHDGGIKCA